MIPQEFPTMFDAQEVMLHGSLNTCRSQKVECLPESNDTESTPTQFSLLKHINDSIKLHRQRLSQETVGSQCESTEDFQRQTKHHKSNKRVRFELEEDGVNDFDVKVQVMGPLIKPSSEMTDIEREEIWWTDSDYDTFRKNVSDIAGDLNRARESLPGSYSKTLVKVYQECATASSRSADGSILTPQTKTDLEEWTKAALARRGLEYISVAFLLEARGKNRADAIKRVFDLQRKMNNSTIFDPSLKEETFRNFLEAKTRPAQLFAQVLAEADAAALAEPRTTGRSHRRATV